MNRIVLFFLLLLFGFFSWLAWASTNLAGGEDGVMHHMFARYAPEHPSNLLDLWAKPLFTLFSMPFALFGFFGSQVFNILCGLTAGWLTWKSAERIGQERAWVAIILLVFSTQYFFVMPSSVTEVLFSLVLIGAFFSLVREKYVLAAFIISFIPYARTEGYVLILMFAITFLVLKQWKALPFLVSGSLAYSLAGYFAGEDFLWLWTKHPYSDASLIYGHGTWYHYFEGFKEIWGFPLTIMILIGTGAFIYDCVQVIKGRKKADRIFWILLFAVFGSFYGYLAGHSYVWWKGYSGSLGLIRVMAGTMPLAAIIGLFGLNRFLYMFNPNLRIFKSCVTFIAILYMFISCFTLLKIPFHGDEERRQILIAGEWYRGSKYYGENKVYYFAPSVAQAFGVDPFDLSEKGDLGSVLTDPDVPKGTIVVWDAHFGPNESHLPVDSLHNRPEFEQIAHFKPDFDLRTLNNYPYEIYIFRKK